MKLIGKYLLQAAADDDTAAIADLRKLGNLETTHYVSWGTGVTAGVVEIETADKPDYAGTWANLAVVTFAGTAPYIAYVQLRGVFGAIRHRVTTAVSDGTVTTKIEGS